MKLRVVCPNQIVKEAWDQLTVTAGWSPEKAEETQKEFFQIVAEKAARKKQTERFPKNFVFSRSYKSHRGRFLVIAHFAPMETGTENVLNLTHLGTYTKIWESDRLFPLGDKVECNEYTATIS
jgi:hypothetical protein